MKKTRLVRCYRVLRWFLAGAFVFSAISKSLDAGKFAKTIAEFGIVVEGTEFATAIFLVVSEFVEGIGLLKDVKGSLAAVLSLLRTFLAVLCYGLWLGLDIDYGCLATIKMHRSSSIAVSSSVCAATTRLS